MSEIKLKPKKVTKSYYFNGIEFTSLKEVISIAKINKECTWDYFYKDFLYYDDEDLNSLPEYHAAIAEAKEVFDSVKPLTPKQIFKNYANNAEKRMVALSVCDPQDILANVDAELVDSQTVSKKQWKTVLKNKSLDVHNKKTYENLKPNDIEEVFHEYEDTYELYKIKPETIGINVADRINNIINFDEKNQIDDVYFVKCKDTSTDRIYYLYVRPNTDAISAIASTMAHPTTGKPLTKEEYLSIQSET